MGFHHLTTEQVMNLSTLDEAGSTPPEMGPAMKNWVVQAEAVEAQMKAMSDSFKEGEIIVGVDFIDEVVTKAPGVYSMGGGWKKPYIDSQITEEFPSVANLDEVTLMYKGIPVFDPKGSEEEKA